MAGITEPNKPKFSVKMNGEDGPACLTKKLAEWSAGVKHTGQKPGVNLYLGHKKIFCFFRRKKALLFCLYMAAFN
jgi:hypothetical protein